MIQSIHDRIVLYGYGYTGRFLKWYAEYYHNIKVDYIISLDMKTGQNYDQEIFRPSVLDFNYKDIKKCILWVAEPMDDALKLFLQNRGYVRDATYFDFYGIVYGEDVCCDLNICDVFRKGKSGKRDIQFLEWLEWKYQCNFVTAIESKDFKVAKEHGNSYRVTTQKEIFPILDRCHCIPTMNDAIFDYDCGKGGAMVSFLDYGFTQVGGVEYEPQIYDVLIDNLSKLNLKNDRNIECFCADASTIDKQLDKYNWFYFFNPFDNNVLKQCIAAIHGSLNRKKRKIHIIYVGPIDYRFIEEVGIFRLTSQFTIDTRQRVVNVYVNYGNEI